MPQKHKTVAELTAQQREKAYFDKLEKDVKHLDLILRKRKLNQELGIMDTDTLGVLFMEVEAHIETQYPDLLKQAQEARTAFLMKIGYKEELYRENYKRFLQDVVKSQMAIPDPEPSTAEPENPSKQLHIIRDEITRQEAENINAPDTSDEPPNQPVDQTL